MRLDFSALPEDMVEDWKHHPGTQYLVKVLAAAQAHWSGRCEKSAANGETANVTSGLGGRALQLRETLTDIVEAKGETTK